MSSKGRKNKESSKLGASHNLLKKGENYQTVSDFKFLIHLFTVKEFFTKNLVSFLKCYKFIFYSEQYVGYLTHVYQFSLSIYSLVTHYLFLK